VLGNRERKEPGVLGRPGTSTKPVPLRPPTESAATALIDAASKILPNLGLF
jgi:hypothetical protein